MLDNVQANAPTTAGAKFKTDKEVSTSEHAPFTKLMFGATGTFPPVDGTNGLPVDIITGLDTLESYTSNLVGIAGNISVIVSGINSIITDLNFIGGYVDGLESLISTSNTALSAIAGYVDGLEGLVGTTNATLSAISGYVDGLEGLIGTTNTTLTSIAGYVDGLETLIGTTNTSLSTINTTIGTGNTTLSSINTKITACNTGAVVLAAGIAEIGNVKNSGTFAVQATQASTWTVGVSAGQTIAVTNAGTFATQISSALPAGTNVIGHVIVDSGSIAATQSGTWTVGVSPGQTIAVTNAGTFAVQAAQSGTWTVDTELPAVAALADATANPTTTSVGTLGLMYNGTTWDRIRGDTTNGIKVNATKLTPDGTNTMPSLDVASRAGFVKVTDGTNTLPTLDAVGRAGFVKVTDGTNTMPTMDSTSRPGFVNLNLSGVAVSSGTGNAGTGTIRVAIATDQPALTNTQPVKDLAQTSGGLSMHCSGPLANSNNATTVKASAGQVYAIQVFNVTATVAYLKLYNKASNPTPASDTAVKVIPIPANTSVGGVSVKWEKGLEFTTGIAYAVVTGISGTDNTSVAANSGIVNIDYK